MSVFFYKYTYEKNNSSPMEEPFDNDDTQNPKNPPKDMLPFNNLRTWASRSTTTITTIYYSAICRVVDISLGLIVQPTNQQQRQLWHSTIWYLSRHGATYNVRCKEQQSSSCGTWVFLRGEHIVVPQAQSRDDRRPICAMWPQKIFEVPQYPSAAAS